MRGVVSDKLKDFLAQVAIGLQDANAQGAIITPELTRTNLEKLSAFLPDGPPVTLINDSQLSAPGRNIKVRIYHPAPDKPLPVLLHFHGGGHMCGSIELYDPISRELAARNQVIVITVDYRLSPEYPYPCGLDDCEYTLHHYQALLQSLDLAFGEELLIAGDSAGGAICTSLVMNNLRQPRVTIDKQVLIYPSVDYTLTQPSITENGQGFLLEAAKIQWYFNAYFGTKTTDTALIRAASPLLGPFSENMPATLIITAGCDPLRDEGNAYAKALSEANANVTHHQLDGMVHAYMLLHSLVETECEQTYQLIEQFIAPD